jgi:hypothetical protein
MANWEFEGEGGEAKSGLMGLLAMSQSQYGLETGIDNQYVIVDPDSGVLSWYGDRGDGTVEQLVVIDSGGGPYGDIFGTFGSTNSPYIGVAGFSGSADGVLGYSVSGYGVYGTSDVGMGVLAISSANYAMYAFRSDFVDYAIYAVTGIYSGGNVSALSFTDRTPYYNGDALLEIKKIKGKDGLIDHSTLPDFARTKLKVAHAKNIKAYDMKSKSKQISFSEEVEEEGRDLGAMISIITVGIQQLTQRVEALEKK